MSDTPFIGKFSSDFHEGAAMANAYFKRLCSDTAKSDDLHTVIKAMATSGLDGFRPEQLHGFAVSLQAVLVDALRKAKAAEKLAEQSLTIKFTT